MIIGGLREQEHFDGMISTLDDVPHLNHKFKTGLNNSNLNIVVSMTMFVKTEQKQQRFRNIDA